MVSKEKLTEKLKWTTQLCGKGSSMEQKSDPTIIRGL